MKRKHETSWQWNWLSSFFTVLSFSFQDEKKTWDVMGSWFEFRRMGIWFVLKELHGSSKLRRNCVYSGKEPRVGSNRTARGGGVAARPPPTSGMLCCSLWNASYESHWRARLSFAGLSFARCTRAAVLEVPCARFRFPLPTTTAREALKDTDARGFKLESDFLSIHSTRRNFLKK